MGVGMTIFVGADHNGWHLQRQLTARLRRGGHKVTADSADNPDPDDDFPVLAARVCRAILDRPSGEARGILICGSGQGMVMAANRFRGIRAVLLDDEEQARLARNDDDSNVLAIGARHLQVDFDRMLAVIEVWLTTPFEALPRRRRRLTQLDQLSH